MKADDLISTLTWKYLFDCCNAASSQVSIKFLWFLQKQVRWITKVIIVPIMSWFDIKPSLKLFFFRFYFAETVLAFWSIVTYMGSDAGQPPDSWSPPLTTSCSPTSAWAWWASCLFATNLHTRSHNIGFENSRLSKCSRSRKPQEQEAPLHDDGVYRGRGLRQHARQVH